MSVDCRTALVIILGLVGGQEINRTYVGEDDFITTSTDSPDDNNIASSLKTEIIGGVMGAFLLLVIMAGIILTIINRRSKTSLHLRPSTHFMMYSMSVTPKFAQTLKESMHGSRPSSSAKSIASSRHIHVAPTRSMDIDRRVSEDHRRSTGLRSSADLRSERVQQRHEQANEQDESEMVVPTCSHSSDTFSREILQPPSYDDAISMCTDNDVDPPPYYYNT